jgi:hypothetical protein
MVLVFGQNRINQNLVTFSRGIMVKNKIDVSSEMPEIERIARSRIHVALDQVRCHSLELRALLSAEPLDIRAVSHKGVLLRAALRKLESARYNCELSRAEGMALHALSLKMIRGSESWEVFWGLMIRAIEALDSFLFPSMRTESSSVQP